jgi:hypothetical protein
VTNAPSDLTTFRTGVVIPLTGLSGNDVGIAPDASHTSGYHVGCEDIQRAGKWNSDYSTRQARDRLDGTNLASAMDIGDDWPHGGRAGWLRFNNLLVAQLRARDPGLAAVRAVNFSPDGTLRKRYDSFNAGQGVIDSTDSVYMHTHLEWWRDTAGTPVRARSLVRLGQIISAAIRYEPLEADVNLTDKVPGTGTSLTKGADRTVGDILKDVANLRAAFIGEAPAAAVGYGPATPLGQLLALAAAGPAKPVDLAALASALAPLLQVEGVEVTSEQIAAALNSDEAQAALVKAANTAEDS